MDAIPNLIRPLADYVQAELDNPNFKNWYFLILCIERAVRWMQAIAASHATPEPLPASGSTVHQVDAGPVYFQFDVPPVSVLHRAAPAS